MTVSHHERMRAVLAGQKPDRTPVALWRHFPVDDQDPHLLAAATLAFQREFEFDFVKVTPASSFSVRDWGARDVWEGDPEGTRRYLDPVISSPGDWKRLRDLDPRKGSLGAQLDCLKEIRLAVGPETPVIQTVFNPLAQAGYLAGKERMVEHLRRWPDALASGLETIARVTVRFVEACVQAGADGIFLASQHSSLRLLSVGEYRQWGRPHDLRALEAASGCWLNVLHLHGEAVMFAELSDYPVQVINWHDREAGPSLREGWRLSKKVVCGGWEQWETIVRGTPARIGDQAQEAVAQMRGRNLVLGTGCVAPAISPRANLLAASRPWSL